MSLKVLQCIFLLFIIASSNASLVDTFVSSVGNFWPKSREVSRINSQKLPSISFELPHENEEFLKEGLALIDSPRSALDLCSHRVVSTLKSNCNQLTMEEVGKLAVMLLNCQLEVEGRDTFSCKPEMTLKQCTIAMDDKMYSIYNYMVHRAFGICSAIKSDQFRAMTEIAVNRLLHSTQSQVDAMTESLSNQQKLNEMAAQNLKNFEEHGEKIKESQTESLSKLKLAGSLIEENLMSLQQELELRQKSEEKLSLIESSASEISNKLEQHTSKLDAEHGRLLKNVDDISNNLQKNNMELLHQYNQMLEFLNSFESVVSIGSNIIGKIRTCIESFVEIAQETGLELSMDQIASLIINLAYFTSGMVFMLFIGAQWISRSLLILLFVFNCVATYFKANIDFLPLNLLTWITFLAIKAVGVLQRKISETEFTLPPFLTFRTDSPEDEDDKGVKGRSQTPMQRAFASYKKAVEPLTQKFVKKEESRMFKSSSTAAVSSRISKDDSKDVDNELSEFFTPRPSSRGRDSPMVYSSSERPMTPAMRRVLNESSPGLDRSGTPFLPGMSGRVRCLALTAKQVQCKNAAVPGLTKCRVHNY